MGDIQPLSSASDPSATSTAPTAAATDTSQMQDKTSAFQLALSRALNAPQALSGAGGTDNDDNDDGTGLTVQLSGGIAVP